MDITKESIEVPKPAVPLKEEAKPSIEEALAGPVGLDIGTANIVVSRNSNKGIRSLKQSNAFFTIPYSKITEKTLGKDAVPFFKKGEKLYVLGDAAEDFANIFGGDTRRPIESGILNPKEEEGIGVIQAIIAKLVGKPQRPGERICYSIPGDPIDRPAAVVYHESIVKKQLLSLGYEPEPINEGLAVILSELAATNFTGIGISLGGGMCNVCFSYLSVPVVKYSIQKGGDYIDEMVGSSVGEKPTKIKVIKEQELDLAIEPRNRIETGLQIYYEDLFKTLAESMQQVLGSSDNIPRLSNSIPIVLSGGTVLPRGSRKKFIEAIGNIRLPLKTSDVLITEKPLFATARGALAMAMIDDVDF